MMIQHRLRYFVVAAVGVLACSGGQAGGAPQRAAYRQLCKVDPAGADPTWVGFREELSAIVRARDAGRLRALVHPEIFIGIDRVGLAEFEREWEFRSPKGELWNEMEAILRIGGSSVEDGVVCMPYVNCLGPEFGDPAHDAVVLGENVPAYARPATDSEVVERLTCAILPGANDVMRVPPPAPRGWMPLIAGSRWVFVRDEQIRMIAGVEAHFKRVGTQWKLIAFYAGD